MKVCLPIQDFSTEMCIVAVRLITVLAILFPELESLI